MFSILAMLAFIVAAVFAGIARDWVLCLVAAGLALSMLGRFGALATIGRNE